MKNSLIKGLKLMTALLACSCCSLNAVETDYTKGLSIWFDTPNTLEKRAIWYNGRRIYGRETRNRFLPVIPHTIRTKVGNRSLCLSVTVV